MPPRLTETLVSLGCPQSTEIADAVALRLGSFEPLHQHWDQAASRLDVSDRTDDEVRAWLWALPWPADAPVMVAWPRDHTGATMPFALFVEHFDDLWYPATDDLVVLGPDGALLFLDHEERFSVTSRNIGP